MEKELPTVFLNLSIPKTVLWQAILLLLPAYA
jgi:hypothetical protein